MADARLAELAQRYAIDLAYHDVWGNLHEAPEATLRALLAAMDVPAGDAAAVEKALHAHEHHRWRAVLPPVIVVRGSALSEGMRVQMPAGREGRALTWRVVLEDGNWRDGSFEVGALRELERAEVAGTGYRAAALPLPPDIAPGYHRLALFDAGKPYADGALIVTPDRCYVPEAIADGGRVWGGALQLYGLRSERNWGMGDFTDLRTAVAQWGARGGALLGMNPLHALFLHNPAHASPYSPSSRLFLNPLYLDVEAIEDFRDSVPAREHARSPDFLMRLKRLRDAELVDYPGVAACKRPLLEMLFDHFRRHHMPADTPRARAFRDFCAARGLALRRYALFEALQEHLHRRDPRVHGWQQWPSQYRDPASGAVAQFAKEHTERVAFFEYLQWQADVQLAYVETQCFEQGMSIGLYTDLAVSVDRGGAEAWANQRLYALGASVGAPPDEFNIPGQDWGLPPLAPERLRAAGFAPLIATLRANMAHSGALRIDHVMGLARLYWVPAGMNATEGTYVRYPFEELLGIVALESHRHRCLVVGEDLGTVPDEVRRRLRDTGVLSYRLFMFEREGPGHFKPPAVYPAEALTAFSTHDLPTLAGYWLGQDVQKRAELGLYQSPEQRDAQVLCRAQERAALLLALGREGLLPPGAGIDPVSVDAMTPELALAVHAYLARTAAAVMVVQFEDLLGVPDQANLPGTVDQHPNWRRKLPLALERWEDDERFRQLTATLAALRKQRQASRRRPARPPQGLRIPRATYRVQLHREFTFRDATALVPYLAALGISHIYCSPYLRARSGSAHGYDIIDHQALNPEIGSRKDFDAFVAALAAHDMGQIMDIVPNHMGVMGADNAWWMEVLENGPASVHADFFDIDWQPASADLANRVLLPVLGDHYGSVLGKGKLVLWFEPEAGAFSVHYNNHRFPVDPREYPRILERAVEGLSGVNLPGDALAEFRSLISAFGYLPARDERAPERIAERSSNKEVHKRRLVQLAAAHAPLLEAIAAAVHSFNGTPGEPASFDALHELLEAQAYRLAYWRVASDEINYRRFFDINDLAALRMENEAVFEATHRFVFELVAGGAADALRIDHPDGLFDPAAYFRRLQSRYLQLAAATGADMPITSHQRSLYVVVEKIIAPFENMPETWAVYGTTGYRFANVVNGLFVDTSAEAKLTRIYQAFIGDRETFEEIANRSKRVILRGALASELTVLSNQLARIARAGRSTRDYTLNTLRVALTEIIAAFPVYRTYIADEVTAEDRRYVEWAVARARRHSRAADATIFDFVKSVLLCDAPAADAAHAAAIRTFACKFQQLTAPVMAKGVEDTAFYIYNRLLSLNDVGGDPGTFGYAVSAFHGASADRAAKWPHTMLATSTHDNKRSEDVRARIDVLSEMPAAWRLQLRRWTRMNRSKKRTVEAAPAPTRNDEYLIYQTLIGSFPAVPLDAPALADYRERIERYVLKAVREAKVNSSWINPNEEYESAITHFVRALLAGPERNLFLDDFRAAMVPLAWLGMLNSLSIALIKLTSPGVPDCYQGNEMWDFSLVDPDNRRPVDYVRRCAALSELAQMAQQKELNVLVRALFSTAADGRVKMYLIWRLLTLRRERSELFLHGGYTPLSAEGSRTAHVVAYARRHEGCGVIAIAGRLFASLGLTAGALPCGPDVWNDTHVKLPFLADGTQLRHALTGGVYRVSNGSVPVADVFADFPGAALVYDGADAGHAR